MNIDQIEIAGFKSVARLTLNQLKPYSVFAGPNGSGKSNLMDALAFVSAVIELGAVKAIRKFRGFPQIHCYKLRRNNARTFEFDIHATMNEQKLAYSLKIHDLHLNPQLEERLSVDGETLLSRKKGGVPTITKADGNKSTIELLPVDYSALMFIQSVPLYEYLTNIQVFRFDPMGAKEPDASSADATVLDPHGHNVATMLATLEKNDEFRAQVTDWMTLLVPGMEQVRTEPERLSGGTVIKFKEYGIKSHFPANLISDGTIYALCIMTAVLSRSEGYGITLIEEPERGIHPKGIEALADLMRENATPEHPVFVTTHSESLVRASSVEELWLVNKMDGKTVAKNAAESSSNIGQLNLDTAWLMNLFDGGLPW
ncbi:ABC transporter ATP-binding protein [Janthinobacterium svalbardensis]|uniref:ABC transporter ATP-binding protein n=1 Tax=Janthinobacterium svalbardensis TaxID=368607 RepID=A0A290WSS7_9BURK|nr:ATP-binding protein [Janthinobacterium svalbardensis]ATD59942.1 ABC transporter ATP-binding protein [Janthinobacterium svalbardensis]